MRRIVAALALLCVLVWSAASAAGKEKDVIQGPTFGVAWGFRPGDRRHPHRVAQRSSGPARSPVMSSYHQARHGSATWYHVSFKADVPINPAGWLPFSAAQIATALSNKDRVVKAS